MPRLIVLALVAIGAVFTAPIALAEVPVVDLAQPSQTVSSLDSITTVNESQASRSLEQRIVVLDRQIKLLTQMDWAGQIDQLQQEIAQLRGQLDEQNHELKRLNEQVKAQYQDIDTRLAAQANKALANTSNDNIIPIVTSTKASNPLVDPLPMSTTTTTYQPNSEQQVYQAAIDLSKKGDYVRATTAFQNYLSQYPNGKFAANGHYWLGEIYLIQGQPDPATAEFKIIIYNFPSSPKVPDALLKLGQAHYDKGDWQQAKEHFEKVHQQFPNTPAALSAQSKLHKMQQEGKTTLTPLKR